MLLSSTAGEIFVGSLPSAASAACSVGQYATDGSTINAALIPGLTLPYGIAASESDLFVTSWSGTVNEYTTAGVGVKTPLVSGLDYPWAIALSGPDLFITEGGGKSDAWVSEYTTAGVPVNQRLVTGLTGSEGIAVSGGDLFVTNQDWFAGQSNGAIGEYTTSGQPVNASLISGLDGAGGIAVSGNDLFVANNFSGTIGEYTTSGQTINASLISGLFQPYGIAIFGSDLFVTSSSGTVAEYTTSGQLVNASLVSGLNEPGPIQVVPHAAHLAFGQVPDAAVANQAITPALTIAVDDADGNLLGSDNSDVTLSIDRGPTGGVLNGATTVTAQNGIATFNDLTFSEAGSYTLTAIDGNFLSASSTPIDVTAALTRTSPLVPTFGGVKLPPTIVAGSKLAAKVPVLVTNHGSAFKGSVNIKVFADTGTNLNGAPVLITSADKVLSLKSGKAATVNFIIKSLPPNVPDGTYHLLADVTDPSGNSSVVASTQTVEVAAAFIKPDVSVGAVNPSSNASGKSGAVVVTVTNAGNIAASGISISLSPSQDGTTPLADIILDTLRSGAKILPGKSKTYTLRFKVPAGLTAGRYFPYLTVSLGDVSTTSVGSSQFTIT